MRAVGRHRSAGGDYPARWSHARSGDQDLDVHRGCVDARVRKCSRHAVVSERGAARDVAQDLLEALTEFLPIRNLGASAAGAPRRMSNAKEVQRSTGEWRKLIAKATARQLSTDVLSKHGCFQDLKQQTRVARSVARPSRKCWCGARRAGAVQGPKPRDSPGAVGAWRRGLDGAEHCATLVA